MSYKVTAAYVTLRVKNDLGQDVLLGFYEGAPVPESVNKEDLERHIRKGMVAEEGTLEADLASPVGRPVQFDSAGMPIDPKAAAKAPARAETKAPAKAAEKPAEKPTAEQKK